MMMKLYMRNLHMIWKISTEKKFGKIEKKNFEIFPRFFFSSPKSEPEGDRREPKGEYVSSIFSVKIEMGPKLIITLLTTMAFTGPKIDHFFFLIIHALVTVTKHNTKSSRNLTWKKNES